jgi:hypothetical protein
MIKNVIIGMYLNRSRTSLKKNLGIGSKMFNFVVHHNSIISAAIYREPEPNSIVWLGSVA